MATTFLNAGGDEDFGANTISATVPGFWTNVNGSPIAQTDFIHSPHLKSIAGTIGGSWYVGPKNGVVADAGGRISFYFYMNALPSNPAAFLRVYQSGLASSVLGITMTTGGVIQILNGASTQIGSNGTTLSIGQWYRITLAYTITSTSVNTINLWVNGVSSNAITNASLTNISTSTCLIGAVSNDATFDVRISDIYIDNSSANTDPGNVWVTAKRPFSNGTTNGFTTQIGSGGSGYGSGHAPQVNERPLSLTNGWSMVGTGSAITEEYTVEGASAGDMNSGTIILDYMGWVVAGSLVGETANIIVGGTLTGIALTSTPTLFQVAKGSTTYPAGGTDIGLQTTTALTTVSLYEAGLSLAFIGPPATGGGAVTHNLSLLGIGS